MVDITLYLSIRKATVGGANSMMTSFHAALNKKPSTITSAVLTKKVANEHFHSYASLFLFFELTREFDGGKVLNNQLVD